MAGYRFYISIEIADEYEEIMQKLMKNNDLVTELKKFLDAWSIGGASSLRKVTIKHYSELKCLTLSSYACLMFMITVL